MKNFIEEVKFVLCIPVQNLEKTEIQVSYVAVSLSYLPPSVSESNKLQLL